jgi:hypothetical protein
MWKDESDYIEARLNVEFAYIVGQIVATQSFNIY